MSSSKKRKSWWRRLTNRYRLVIINDDTLEEETSFHLTRLNLYLLISTVLVIMFGIVLSLVLFTPLKEYILGYRKVTMKEKLVELRLAVDSMENRLQTKNTYIQNVRNIIASSKDTGFSKTPPRVLDTSRQSKNRDDTSIDFGEISEQDSILRAEMENRQQYYLHEAVAAPRLLESADLHFFSPLTGIITNHYDREEEHLGVDIVAPKGSMIKATLDGVVVFSGWTAQAGKVVAIQHENNLLSFYKHNSELLKKSGTFVKAGDAIAIIGNTGKYTTGPHLHFELWHQGQPVDPEKYIKFN